MLGLVAVVVLVGGILLSITDQFFVDLLWFRSLGYGSVFATTIKAEVAIFAAVWLFAFATMDEAVAAVEAINSDYRRHCEAARALAEEYFEARKVAARLLADVGLA